MYARQITSEETYTLSEAKRIIKAESKAKREVFISKAKNMLFALIGLTIAIVILLMQEDGFIAIISLICSVFYFKEALKNWKAITHNQVIWAL